MMTWFFSLYYNRSLNDIDDVFLSFSFPLLFTTLVIIIITKERPTPKSSYHAYSELGG